MEARSVRFCVCNASPPFIVENAPAQVCLRCGGEVFADSTVEVFEQIRDSRMMPHGETYVKVFDFLRIQVDASASIAFPEGDVTRIQSVSSDRWVTEIDNAREPAYAS